MIGEIIHLQEKITGEKIPPHHPLWEELILLTGRRIFLEFTPKHIAVLIKKLRVAPGVMKEIIPMVEASNKHPGPFSSYPDISSLYNISHPGNVRTYPSIETKRALRDVFLYEINGALQDLYRLYLNTFPPSPGLRHSEKIASLFQLEGLVYKMLAACGLEKRLKWLSFEKPGKQVDRCLARLSNYMFPLWQVNFRFTNHCNISCKHCYNSSGPACKEPRLNLDRMLRVIEEMSALRIPQLNITGGEPFLYTGDVAALITHARKQRIKRISIFTNGFWAESPAKCKETLRILKRAGFMGKPGLKKDVVKVSAGIYHQEFIPFRTVMNLAEIYHDFFHEPVQIDYELHDTSPGAKSRVISEIKERGLQEKVRLFFREVEPAGRGVRLLEKCKLKNPGEPCTGINQVVFDPGGTAKPCCGMNDKIPGIHIGDINKHSLQTLVKNMQNDPVLQFIAKNPVKDMFKYLEKDPRQEGYPGLCSLCRHALGDLEDKEPLKQELFFTQEYYPFWFSREKLHHYRISPSKP